MPIESLSDAVEALASPDPSEAISYVSSLAKDGVPGAIGLLGYAYYTGQGVPVDGPRAVSLLAEAAALGDGASAHNLGTLYLTGLPGVDTNQAKARAFYLLARRLGCVVAPPEFYEKMEAWRSGH